MAGEKTAASKKKPYHHPHWSPQQLCRQGYTHNFNAVAVFLRRHVWFAIKIKCIFYMKKVVPFCFQFLLIFLIIYLANKWTSDHDKKGYCILYWYSLPYSFISFCRLIKGRWFHSIWPKIWGRKCHQEAERNNSRGCNRTHHSQVR